MNLSPEDIEILKTKRQRHLQLLSSVDSLANDIKNLEEELDLIKDDDDKWEEMLLRVNLPTSESAFLSGNGEGCWAVVSSRVKEMYDNFEEGGIHVALLNNFPFDGDWRHLRCGDPVLMTLRGDCRPVAFVDQEEAVQKYLNQDKN